MNARPVIKEEICQGCGLCVSVCRCGALVIFNHRVKVIHIDSCGWCGLCELVCPTGAITCPYEIVVEEHNDSRR